jgi:hypothetical protein
MAYASRTDETERVIPCPALAFDQSFQRACNLPFLIALGPEWQRASFLHKLCPGLDQTIDVEKVRVPGQVALAIGRERYRTLSHR